MCICIYIYISTHVDVGICVYMKVKVIQSCPAVCNPMDYTIHGIPQARILEWAAFPSSRGSCQPKNWTRVSCIAGGFITNWAIREAHTYICIHVYIHINFVTRHEFQTSFYHLQATRPYSSYWIYFSLILLNEVSKSTQLLHGWGKTGWETLYNAFDT